MDDIKGQLIQALDRLTKSAEENTGGDYVEFKKIEQDYDLLFGAISLANFDKAIDYADNLRKANQEKI